jgi:NAD(P)-dependent dehydrogenase (short-subunit alcohol dehydrogenase family)
MTKDTDGRVVLVTGGAGGLGFETARRFHGGGASVVIADLDEQAALAAAEQIDASHDRALGLAADVTSTPSIDRMVAATLDRFDRLDVLINNAGFAAPSPTHTLEDEAWLHMLDVHLNGTLRCSRSAFRALSNAPHAAIVNIASIAAYVGMPMRASYTAAKAGISGLTRVLAVEWAPVGIRVNAVAPGFIATPLMTKLIEEGTNSAVSMTSLVPMGRLADPHEIAAVIEFAASPAASYLTGQTVVVDGGMTIDGRLPGLDGSVDPSA